MTRFGLALVCGLVTASCAALPDPDGCEMDCYICIAVEVYCLEPTGKIDGQKMGDNSQENEP